MTRTLISGGVLAVAAAVMLLLGDMFGWGLEAVVIAGAAAGGVLGLVNDRGPLPRVLGFLIGMVLTGVVYGVRALLLPDSTSGRALAVVILFVLVAAVAALTFGRIPLWTLLLGVAALAGPFEAVFTDSPGSVLSTLPVWLTSVLVMAAVGFAATVFFSGSEEEEEPRRTRHSRSTSPSAEGVEEEEVGLDDVLHKGGN